MKDLIRLLFSIASIVVVMAYVNAIVGMFIADSWAEAAHWTFYAFGLHFVVEKTQKLFLLYYPPAEHPFSI